ncbi:MAG: polysaccharide biosynthesis protein, partial [Sulfurovum sp.]|nr:polysaccharide biosynthesis protein [Sulfurovum sp.]NNJ44891.1 polysaccharide biosynthesis protein [Sulfurovum sp.]
MIRPSPFKRTLFFMFFDAILSLGTLFLAYNLRFNFDIEKQYLENFFLVFSILLFLKITAITYFKIYRVSWRFVSLYEAKKLFYAHIFAYGLFVLIFYAFPEAFSPFPRSVLIIDLFLSVFFIGILRMAKRLIVEGRSNINLTKTLLIGVSPFAQTLFKEQNDFYISAIVDDSEMVVDSYFSNMQVNKFEDIEMLVQRDGIKSVIIAKALDQDILKSLYLRLHALNIYDIKIVTLEQKEKRLKKITVEDLLARHPQDLDLETIATFIKEKSILITGAGGSIGSEIARQCKKFGASSLTLVDNSEYNLYQIGEQIENAELKLVSITDKDRLDMVFKEIMPQIVIHAAAYKHVPICEDNQEMAVFNNVLGSKNVIDVSIENGVKKVVVISTDKAVRPTNVMGATKRVTELYANNVDAKETEIVSVRFGNVLGSSGSVIPKFKQQIEEGGPITVTHPDITRYFMLIPEACQLVLQAAAIAKGGELFILDMGEPIKIVDLAKQMVRLYGKEDEVGITFTGLRPGEKLYEELLIDESEKKTQYSSIFIAQPTPYEIGQLNEEIDNLVYG